MEKMGGSFLLQADSIEVFAGCEISTRTMAIPLATPANQNTKNYENVHKRLRKCNQN